MPKDITPLLELKQEIKSIEKKMDKLEVKYAESQKKLKDICWHPTTVRRSQHYSGGYDYRSSTTVWDECTICGATLNSKSTEGYFE